MAVLSCYFRCLLPSVAQKRCMGSFRQRIDPNIKEKPEYVPNKKKSFIDSLRIYVRGGPGGQGLLKYGGTGGDGGGVYAVAKKNLTLSDVYQKYPTRRFVGGNGHNSTKFYLCGEPGQDKVINVPIGVEVCADDGQIIGDLNQEGDRVCMAAGGKGGNHSNKFVGKRGEHRNVKLNLKLIADVGLVGFPNAGKSSFLKAISRANPKIANYPFTTIKPQIGVAEFPDFAKITVADLPGLIEGAYANFGMGHHFLKHVERTKLLLVLVDIGGFQLAQPYPLRSAFQTILLLNKELELYKEDLVQKPAVLVINKIDTDPDETQVNELMQLLKALPDSLKTVPEEMRPETLIKFDAIQRISAKHCINTDETMKCVRELIDHFTDNSSNEETNLAVMDVNNEESLLQRHGERARKKLV
ncbi:GTP-binding protein 10-like [Pomacea canaliculata]|uniref:GTP-binding protein 10-like n=1 Tax=Pomacea canaliculata TaxID=400727 RepID=UPI000D739798|nr:GTP-binding protein 10-like [Pomacea canaliculata]